jgi:hypothetical protein
MMLIFIQNNLDIYTVHRDIENLCKSKISNAALLLIFSLKKENTEDKSLHRRYTKSYVTMWFKIKLH